MIDLSLTNTTTKQMKFFASLITFAAAIKLQEEEQQTIEELLADCDGGVSMLTAEQCSDLAWCAANPEDEDCRAWAEAEGYDVSGGEETPVGEGQGDGLEEEQESTWEEGEEGSGDDEDSEGIISAWLEWCLGDDE